MAHGGDEEWRQRSHKQASASGRGKQATVESIDRWLDTRKMPPSDEHPPRKEELSLATLRHTLQHGHNWPVTCLVFSPDGKTLATGSRDVRFWEAATGRLLVVLPAHSGMVRAVAYSPDGSSFCTASDDHTLRIWKVFYVMRLGLQYAKTQPDALTAQPVGPPPLPYVVPGRPMPESVTAALMAAHRHVTRPPPLPKDVAAAIAYTFSKHRRPVTCMAYSPDRKRIISGSMDKTVRVFDLLTGFCSHTLRTHRGEVHAVAVTPDNKRFLSAGSDKLVHVYDMESGDVLTTLTGHRGTVVTMALDRSGERLVTGSWDGCLKLWSVSSGEEIATVRHAHTGSYGVLCASFTRDGSAVITGGYDERVRVWDALSMVCLATLRGHRGMVTGVSSNKDSTLLASASRDDTVRLWSWQENYCRVRYSKPAISWAGKHYEQDILIKREQAFGKDRTGATVKRYITDIMGESTGALGGSAAGTQRPMSAGAGQATGSQRGAVPRPASAGRR